MYRLFFSILLFVLPFRVFSAIVDVNVDVPSGTYYAPIYITLTPTEIGAKTFYSFKPDGNPNDAFLYTGAILLKHSSPFIFFSFLSTDNESKIKQNDYIIEYSSAIQFETESISGPGKAEITLVNNGPKAIDLGYWAVQSESSGLIIPEGTIVAPGAKYNINLEEVGMSTVVLRSPDDDEKDILMVHGIVKKNEIILPKKKAITTTVVPRKIISTSEVIPQSIHSESVAATNETISSATNIVKLPPPSESQIQKPNNIVPQAIPNINQIMKVSTNESGQNNVNPMYLLGLLVISVSVGGLRWFMKRGQ